MKPAMDWNRVPDTGLERPSHYVAMSYTVTPELPDGVLTIMDCEQMATGPGKPLPPPVNP